MTKKYRRLKIIDINEDKYEKFFDYVKKSSRHKLRALFDIRKAGDGNRTHVSSLEGWCSTIEPHLHFFHLRIITQFLFYTSTRFNTL